MKRKVSIVVEDDEEYDESELEEFARDAFHYQGYPVYSVEVDPWS
jgi:hypothetical protein